MPIEDQPRPQPTEPFSYRYSDADLKELETDTDTDGSHILHTAKGKVLKLLYTEGVAAIIERCARILQRPSRTG